MCSVHFQDFPHRSSELLLRTEIKTDSFNVSGLKGLSDAAGLGSYLYAMKQFVLCICDPIYQQQQVHVLSYIKVLKRRLTKHLLSGKQPQIRWTLHPDWFMQRYLYLPQIRLKDPRHEDEETLKIVYLLQQMIAAVEYVTVIPFKQFSHQAPLLQVGAPPAQVLPHSFLHS